jgi:hypothetical protein
MEGLGIIPECYIDTCLTETITSCFNQFNHQKGCGTVCKVMQKRFHDSFALGIIDKDKKEVPYLQEFELIASKDSLLIYKHKTKHHYIIQITPAIERFFLKAVGEKDVDLTSYGLSSDIKELTKLTKQVSDKNESTFKTFRRLFVELSDASEMVRLAELILYFGENAYKTDVEDIIKIINS